MRFVLDLKCKNLCGIGKHLLYYSVFNFNCESVTLFSPLFLLSKIFAGNCCCVQIKVIQGDSFVIKSEIKKLKLVF